MAGKNLDAIKCQNAFSELLEDHTNVLQTAAFLVLLRAKIETAEELVGAVMALQQKMITLSSPHKLLDIVGTGGDGASTVNISTGAAILAASCGVKVAKHGNSAVTSMAGSADVLQALGLVIDLPLDKIVASIDEIGIGFCYSPNFHPAMRQLKTLRRSLQVPTSFNLLGPLLHPAQPEHRILGVYDASLLSIMAQALQKLGVGRSFIVHGSGLDELSCIGPTNIIEITPTTMTTSVLDPKQLGFASCTLADLQGGSAQTNAELLLDVFMGKHSIKHQAIANTLILNTAASLYIYGLHNSIEEAVEHAQEKLKDGSALALLNHWIEFSHD